MLYPNAGVMNNRLLRLPGHAAPEAAVLGRQVAEPAAALRLGQPHRSARRRNQQLSRLAEHQPDAGRGDQPDARSRGGTRSRAGSTSTTATRRRTWAPAASPNLTFQGYVNFGNNTNNTLDSGFGYANAALGVFTQYLQASKFIEGNMLYNQVEFYRPGQLEGDQPPDAGLRDAVRASAAAVRPVPADVELLPRPVEGRLGAGALRGRVQQRRHGVLGQRSATRWIRAPGRF